MGSLSTMVPANGDPQVLLLEDLMDQAVLLLCRARRYERRAAAWSLQNAQARSLDDRIRFSFGALAKMRQDVHDEVYSERFQQGKSTTWNAWIAGWVCLSGRKRKNTNKPREEHHQREHVFTPYKTRNQECKCLSYR